MNPRLIFQKDIPEIFGIPLSQLKRLGIKPMKECSSRMAKRYDTKLIEKRLDELSGLSTNGTSSEIDYEKIAIERARNGR